MDSIKKKEYDSVLKLKFRSLIDSTFWKEQSIDNISKFHDGTILEIEGIRQGKYKKLSRKNWSSDDKISLLENFFKHY